MNAIVGFKNMVCRLVAYGVLLSILIAGVAMSTGLFRPLGQDEVVTARTYSCFDYHAPLSEIRQQLHPFDFRLLAVGWGRCFLNRWDPNNHIPNSLAVTVSIFLFGASEWAVRLPALLAGIMMILLIGYWTWRSTGSELCALAGCLALALHPYYLLYAQSARGYTLAAALIVLQLLMLDGMRSRVQPLGIMRLAVLWCSSLLLFLTTPSLVVSWLIPVHGAILLDLVMQMDTSTPFRQRLRQALTEPAVQQWIEYCLALFVMIGIFILAKLPDFLNAQMRYGQPVRTGAEFQAMMMYLKNYYFPGSWVVIAIMGAAGWYFLVREKCRHWQLWLIFFIILVNSAYGIIAHKIPYERTYGFVLLLIWLGVMRLWLMAERFQSGVRHTIRGLILLVCYSTAAWCGFHWVQAGKEVHETDQEDGQFQWFRPGAARHDPSYNVFASEITRWLISIPNQGESDPKLLIRPDVFGEEMTLYLPSDPSLLCWAPVNPPEHLTVLLPCIHRKEGIQFRLKTMNRTRAEFHYWKVPPTWTGQVGFEQSPFVLLALPVMVKPGLPSEFYARPMCLVWYNTDPWFNLGQFLAEEIRDSAVAEGLKLAAWPGPAENTLLCFAGNSNEYAIAIRLMNRLHSLGTGQIFSLIPDTP